jgi:hypothetical protein
MGLIMVSQNIMGSDYGSNISVTLLQSVHDKKKIKKKKQQSYLHAFKFQLQHPNANGTTENRIRV